MKSGRNDAIRAVLFTLLTLCFYIGYLAQNISDNENCQCENGSPEPWCENRGKIIY